MEIVWFGLAVLFLVLWLTKKSKPNNNTIDLNSKTYAQGYWDGHRAHEKEISGVVETQKKATIPIKSIDNVKTLNQLERLESRKAIFEPIIPVSYSMGVTVSKNNEVIDLAAHKAKRDLQNINTTLYVASFLLVAAAALFVGTNLPESVRFMGVWLITIVFYSVGLILHKTVIKLRPAAVAFVGTGLALLPFTGIAMYSFILQDVAACWLITSIIGLLAFIIAAISLKNQVVAYLAIAFGISLATSSVAVSHAGLIWYFIILMLFGCVMTFMAKLKFNWVPICFSKPINNSNNWIVPLTIVASLLAFNEMTVTDYWLVSLISTFYYAAVAVSSTHGRDFSIFLTRFLASIAVMLMAYDFSNSSWTIIGITLSAIGVLQVFISTAILPKRIAGDSNNEVWLWIGFIAQLFAPLLIFADQYYLWASIITGQLLVLLVVSFGVSFILHRAVVSIFGTVALASLPIIWGIYVMTPTLEYRWIALIFLVFGAIALAIRSTKHLITTSPTLHPFLVVNFAIFVVESLVFTLNINASWGFAIWAVATLLIYGLMYLERQPWLSLVSNAMIVALIIRFVQPSVESHWLALICIILATITLVFLSSRKIITIWPSTHQFLVANLGLFIVESLLFTWTIDISWGFAIWIIATLLIYGLMYLERQPWLSVLANIILSIAIWRFVVPGYEAYWISLIFISFAAVIFVIRALTKSSYRLPSILPALLVNIGMFIILSLFNTSGLEFGWSLIIWTVASMIIYGLTYVERMSWLSIIGNLILLVASIWLVQLIEVPDMWKFLVISWIAFVIFYCAYWLLVLYSKANYGVYFWWSAIVVAGLINLVSLIGLNESIIYYAGIGSVVVATAIAIRGWHIRNYEYLDVAAIIATAGLQRILYIIAPDTNILIYTDWWAVIFVGLSYLYYSAGRKTNAKILLYIALIAMSLFSGMAALGWFGASDMPYQTIFLIEHVLLVIIGLILSRKLFTIWGAVGIVLSVLWMMKDQTYLLLASAGLVLIGVAVYALIRKSKKQS